MAEDSTRREFLQKISLTGAALVAGAGALSTTGCGTKDQVEVDVDGKLVIKDRKIAQKLHAVLQAQAKPDNNGDHRGIVVSWEDPGSEGNKVNSLCTC